MSNGFKRKAGSLLASAALATAGLLIPASADARPLYDWRCEQRMHDYCAANWEAEGYPYYQTCVDELIFETCYFGIYPPYGAQASRPSTELDEG